MNKLTKLAMLGVVAGVTSNAMAVWYTSEATFLAAMDPVFYLEDFDDFQYGVQLNGSQTLWSAPGANGYGWDASAALGLWSNDGALSTNSAMDPLILTFTGNPVTAFGGIFYGSDVNGGVVPTAEVTVTLSNGEFQTFTANGTDFLGWTGNAAIASVQLDVVEPTGANVWNTADHVYTGAGVPEPATFVALGIGLAALAVARRKRG
jgi:hypothetical protein